jgi:hypothetical protein
VSVVPPEATGASFPSPEPLPFGAGGEQPAPIAIRKAMTRPKIGPFRNQRTSRQYFNVLETVGLGIFSDLTVDPVVPKYSVATPSLLTEMTGLDGMPADVKVRIRASVVGEEVASIVAE